MTNKNSQPGTVNSRRIWAVCDIMRQADYAGALEYISDITWLLFLRLLDERERRDEQRSLALGTPYESSLWSPYRWRDWATVDGVKRRAFDDGSGGSVVEWINDDLLPTLRMAGEGSSATMRQKMVAGVIRSTERVGVRYDKPMLDILDLLDGVIEFQQTADAFALSGAYEDLLLKMGDAKGDSGQFFTPRVIVQALVEAVAPKIGETVYDPCCGTGGFLAHAFRYIIKTKPSNVTTDEMATLKSRSIYGRERASRVYPICVGNLVLHGIDEPRIWHGDTLLDDEVYGDLFQDAPPNYDVVLTNPPFSAKFTTGTQKYAFESKDTQLLMLQEVMDSLKPGGRAGMVVDEGILFKATASHVGVRRRLLEGFDIRAIVSLASGSFLSAGTGIRTNLLIFERGRPTSKIWYYDVSPPPGAAGASDSGGIWAFTKQYPLSEEHFEEFLTLLPSQGASMRSWTVDREDLDPKTLDIKGVNPHPPVPPITGTPEELLEKIDSGDRELDAALAELRKALAEE